MFRWISRNTFKDRRKNPTIWDKSDKALIEDKVRETRLQWFVMYKGGGP